MMSRSVELILVVVLIASSFWLGSHWRGKENRFSDPSFSEAQQQLANLKDQFQLLYETDLQDYARLKTMEAKYQSANNILAKMMTIFLADLGLKVSQKKIQDMTAPVSASPNMEKPMRSHSCSSTQAKSCPSLRQLAKEQGKVVIDPNQEIKKPTPSWVENEDKLKRN